MVTKVRSNKIAHLAIKNGMPRLEVVRRFGEQYGYLNLKNKWGRDGKRRKNINKLHQTVYR
jgi:hypothetical protein